jgi:hypothetical protein
MQVIGVAGQLAQGKDQLADYLAKRLNERQHNDHVKLWNRIGFAHAVKKVFMDTFDVSWDFIEEWKRKSEPPPGFDLPIRQCLQFIGDGFRKMKSNIWIEVGLRTDKNIIISDVRYMNEAKAIREKGGLTVLMWRKGWENEDPNPSESQIKPTVDWFVQSGMEGDVRVELPGETPCAAGVSNPGLFDFFFRNEGTIEDLYRKVDEILVPAIEEHYGCKTRFNTE